MPRRVQARGANSASDKHQRTNLRPPNYYTAMRSKSSSRGSIAMPVERMVPWWQASLLALLAVVIWNGKNLPLPHFQHRHPVEIVRFDIPAEVPQDAPAPVEQQPPVQTDAEPLAAMPVPPQQPLPQAEKAFQVAVDTGFLRAVLYTCNVKQVPCEFLLAIAKLESNMGLNTVSQTSSARGAMQIIRPEFLRMIKSYSARNMNNLEAYLAILPPDSNEAAGLRRDMAALNEAVNYMNGDAYQRTHTLPSWMQRKLATLNNRPIIQLLFVADRLIDDQTYLETHRNLPPAECIRYAYLAYVDGTAAADVALEAYLNPALRKKPVAPYLVKLYTHVYSEIGDDGARDWAKDTTHEVLINNGQSMSTSVGQFVDMRVTPFLLLARDFRIILARETTPGTINL